MAKKIIVTDKPVRRIDPADVAKALGAVESKPDGCCARLNHSFLPFCGRPVTVMVDDKGYCEDHNPNKK